MLLNIETIPQDLEETHTVINMTVQLEAFGCFLLFGRVVVSLTRSAFLFSIVYMVATMNGLVVILS